MPRPIPNRIRSHRKRWRLTQRELATLLGLKTPSPVSKLERFKGRTELRVALGCAVVFGKPVASLFPGLVAELTEDVLNECEILRDRISNMTSPQADEKRKLLRRLLDRPASQQTSP